MRTLRYTNGILTVLAVLLTFNLVAMWSNAADRGVVASPDLAEQAMAQGIPNPGAQREQMIDLLKRQVQKTDELINLFRSGDARVRVETPQEQQPQ